MGAFDGACGGVGNWILYRSVVEKYAFNGFIARPLGERGPI